MKTQVAVVIKKMFPNEVDSDFEVFRSADGTWEITKWELEFPQPTKEEIEDYWTQNESEILQEQGQPIVSEVSILGQKLVEKDIEIMEMQSINDSLGSQLVANDIRLMMGGL